MKRRTAVVAAAAMTLAVPAAWAGTATDGTHDLTFDIGVSPAKTSTAGKPKAVQLSYQHVFVRKDGTRPQTIYKRLTVTLDKGFVVDPKATAQCRETVLAKASSKCPKGSNVGSGKAVADARPTVATPITAPVTIFNGLEERDANNKPITPRPAIFVVAKVGDMETYFVAEIRGTKLVVDFPTPTSNDLGLFIIREISFKIRAIGTGKRAYIAAPTTCPKRGWSFLETDEFFFGAKTITAKDSQACS